MKKLTIKEFERTYNSSFHFFLSELDTISEVDLAIIIELMRASEHVKNLQKIGYIISPSESYDEESEDFYENDSLIIMIFNISAAQLREALKLFWKVSETEFFKSIKSKISSKDKRVLDSLISLNDEVKKKSGFIFEVLVPVRNLMFHYQTEDGLSQVVSWIKERKEMEGERKPPDQTINLENNEYGPGIEYEEAIFSNYLFWGSKRPVSLMKSLTKVWQTQKTFLSATNIIVKSLLTEENIPKREWGWILKHAYGFKK